MSVTKEIVISHLINCKDTDNLIIKGHILTEHFLNKYIDAKSIEKIDKSAKFSYHQKLEIAQLVGLFKKNRGLKNELTLLNKLRNSIAHNLEYDKNIFTTLLAVSKKVNHEKIKSLSNDASVFIESKEDIFYVKIDGKFIQKGGQTKVSGGHIKFIMTIGFLCGTLDSLCMIENGLNSKSPNNSA